MRLWCLWLFVVCGAGVGGAQTRSPASAARGLNPEAPPETALLGELVGGWDVEQETRSPDGSWGETSTAEWHWYFILDGHAIQDDWIKPPLDEPADGTRSYGTNIRIFDPETDQWVMAWIDTTSRKTATFTAENVDGTIVMAGKNASGRPVRNRFFDITEESFEWVQEWTFDEGQSWTPVVRIHARRRGESPLGPPR